MEERDMIFARAIRQERNKKPVDPFKAITFATFIILFGAAIFFIYKQPGITGLAIAQHSCTFEASGVFSSNPLLCKVGTYNPPSIKIIIWDVNKDLTLQTIKIGDCTKPLDIKMIPRQNITVEMDCPNLGLDNDFSVEFSDKRSGLQYKMNGKITLIG